MRLSKIEVCGFRNLNCEVEFTGDLTLVVGGNNAGKSNVIDALRAVTAPALGSRHTRWISADDFYHAGTGRRVSDTLQIAMTLADLTANERARMITCLSPTVGKDCAQLRLVAQVAAGGRINATWFGGESKQPGIDAWAREAVVHTYLPALRDAAADLRPGRENKLVRLLGALAPELSPPREAMEQAIVDVHQLLENVPVVGEAEREIQSRLSQMAGKRFAQKAQLKFADQRFERIVASLRSLVGDMAPLELEENGLGFNNLLYMATLLAALRNDGGACRHLLLVEEPEAHLHPQLQELLLQFLQVESSANTQVVVTTHSPHFAAGSGIERITVLPPASRSLASVARTPTRFGLSEATAGHLRRFLDVTKAGLLFARGVILVEGIAEQLVVPQLAKKLGMSLTEEGIAVVSVGGHSFAPFAQLFGKDRLPLPCAIVTDGDPPDREEMEEGDPLLSATALALKKLENDFLKVSIAKETFEWDFTAAGNWDLAVAALRRVKPKVAQRLLANPPETMEAQADALLGAVKNTKGRFAQSLAELIDDGQAVICPAYLKEAIEWVTKSPETAESTGS